MRRKRSAVQNHRIILKRFLPKRVELNGLCRENLDLLLSKMLHKVSDLLIASLRRTRQCGTVSDLWAENNWHEFSRFVPLYTNLDKRWTLSRAWARKDSVLTTFLTSFMFLLDSWLLSDVVITEDSSWPSTWQKTMGRSLLRRTWAGQKDTGLGERELTTSAVWSLSS